MIIGQTHDNANFNHNACIPFYLENLYVDRYINTNYVGEFKIKRLIM